MQDFPSASQIHIRNLGRMLRNAAALPRWRMLHEGCCSEHPVTTAEARLPLWTQAMQNAKAGCCSLPQSQPPQGTILGCPKHCNMGVPRPPAPDSFALLAHSEMSSWERPSVKTRPILGMLWERGLAPSSSEKLCSTMCLRARPVMVPFSMYSTSITAFLISSALWYLLRGNSVRTRLEYCTSPTRVAWGDTSSRSTMRFTNCFTSSKFWGRTLLEPSITITRSTCPAPHSVARGGR